MAHLRPDGVLLIESDPGLERQRKTQEIHRCRPAILQIRSWRYGQYPNRPNGLGILHRRLHSLSTTSVFNQKLSLSVEEAAEATGIGRSKLYEAMRDGLLQARKFGRRTIILRDDLEQFLSALPKAA
jgi:excisionase family DNA binding protein